MGDGSIRISCEHLYKFCNGHRFEMGECIAIPELQNRLAELFAKGIMIDAEVFYTVLKAIYEEKYANKKQNREFCYRSARTIMRAFESYWQE